MPSTEIVVHFLAVVPVAGIGPGSSAVEIAATSVGAGILLGGFVAGTVALLWRGGPEAGHIATAGYLGGWAALGLLLRDLFFR